MRSCSCVMLTFARTHKPASYTHGVIRPRFSIIRCHYFFSGEEDSLSEIIFDGSDDELGMDDEEPFDYEPHFEPLEVDQGNPPPTQYSSTVYIEVLQVRFFRVYRNRPVRNHGGAWFSWLTPSSQLMF